MVKNSNFCAAGGGRGSGQSGRFREQYTYTDDGQQLTFSEDDDGDGIFDFIQESTYNSAGLEIRREEKDSNGTVTRRTVYTYDDAGNQLSYSDDADADGTADETISWTYDANGNLLSRTLDSDADGAADLINNYSYDENNRRIYSADDRDADGIDDRIHTFTYNAAGSILTDTYNLVANGPGAESVARYTYDENNNLLERWSDFLALNSFSGNDIKETFTYDANNNVLSQHWQQLGGISWQRNWTYNDQNQLILFVNDNDTTTPGVSMTRTMSYNAQGKIVAEITDDAVAGRDRQRTYSYDASGNLIGLRQDQDSDDDGIFEELIYETVLSGTLSIWELTQG